MGGASASVVRSKTVGASTARRRARRATHQRRARRRNEREELLHRLGVRVHHRAADEQQRAGRRREQRRLHLLHGLFLRVHGLRLRVPLRVEEVDLGVDVTLQVAKRKDLRDESAAEARLSVTHVAWRCAPGPRRALVRWAWWPRLAWVSFVTRVSLQPIAFA